jgi:hypothetical protein
MGETNGKAVKNGFPQARRPYGEGRGLVRKSAPVIRVEPRGYFINIPVLCYAIPVTTPVVSALKNYYTYRYMGLSRISNGFFLSASGFVFVSLLFLKPPHGGFRIEAAVMAGLDRHANFYAIAKTMPVVTAVVCFLSTQNMGS